MNTKCKENSDKNFDKALMLCSNSYLHEDLIHFLKYGDIAEKHYAALEIGELKTKEEADILISNLINCDGKIRESIALKISEFIADLACRDYFFDYAKIFAQSTIDINENISNMIIKSLYSLSDNPEFGRAYSKQLVIYIEEAFEELDKIIYKDKKYLINKQIFKLYKCLNGLQNYYKYVSEDIMHNILERVMFRPEYTVREKAAHLINEINKPEYKDLADKIKFDENYYVRNAIVLCS